METILKTMQHRKVLFLISLPRIPEFLDCIEDVNECLDELRQLHVDVREHIWHEDLAEANKYDVVIVVAHRDASSDKLILEDGSMSISDFVSSIPTDFKGVIDFSSCYSATAFASIKERCPQCKAQVALVETTLLRRLIIYPTLVEYLYENPEIEYGTAYNEVSKAFDDLVDEIDDTDTNKAPMAHLGQKRTSIYAPPKARRKSLVPIYVFLHCDPEKEIVNKKADRNTIIYISSEDLGDFEIGETLNLELSLIPCDDFEHLHIEGADRKAVTISDDIVKELFIVRIGNEFQSVNFGCYISVYKDSQNTPIRKYPIFIDVVNSSDDVAAFNEDEELVNQLTGIFYGDKEKVKKFLSEIRGLRPNSITGTVNRYVEKGWISNHGNSRKGDLWKILYAAQLYTKSKSNWNSQVK